MGKNFRGKSGIAVMTVALYYRMSLEKKKKGKSVALTEDCGVLLHSKILLKKENVFQISNKCQANCLTILIV